MESQEAWRALFLELVDELCRQFDSEPVARGHDDGLPLEIELDIDGHVVDLCHDWSPGPDRITARVRCGTIPEESSATTLKRLLQAQHEADPCEGMSFGLEPQTGALLMVANMKLHGLSAVELLARLRKIFGALAVLRDGDTLPNAEGSMREVILQTFTS
jgi:hypothetical protein